MLSRSEAGMLGYLKAGSAMRAYSNERHKIAFDRYNADPPKCVRCNKILPYEKRDNKYCNHSCRAISTNLQRGAKHKCELCGERVYRDSRWCSIKCAVQGRWNARVAKIEATGIETSPFTAKRYLAEKFGYKCSNTDCEISTWRNSPLSLTLDHTDGNPLNNAITNQRLLCPNCHSQTPSFAGRNRGKGRVARRERDRIDYRRKQP